MKTDCKDFKKEDLPHKAFCDRWFIALEADGSTCHQCEYNPAFVENVLLPNRIKILEKQYRPAPQQSPINPAPVQQRRTELCDYEGEETSADRRCCGGKIEKVKIIYCHNFKEKREKAYCSVCPNYQVKK